MRQKAGTQKPSAETVIKDIRRVTRKQYGAEEKIRIVLEGLRGEESIAALCRREAIAESLYYNWSKEFLEAGKKRLAGDTARAATTDEVKVLRKEARDLKEVVAEQALELRLLKKKHDRGWGRRRMRYPASEKLEIIQIVERSHLPARRTLEKLGIPRATFHRWYDRFLTGGVDALQDRSPRPGRVWNRIPEPVRDRIAAATDGISLSGRFVATAPVNERSLHDAVFAAVQAGLAGKEHVGCAALPRANRERDMLIVACALDASGQDIPSAPAAVVFISDPLRRQHVPADILASLFGLTPAECQVAVHLAQGHRLEEIATRLEVSQTTVSYHMRNLFQKTGTNRQADLIALVLTGPMAVSFG